MADSAWDIPFLNRKICLFHLPDFIIELLSKNLIYLWENSEMEKKKITDGLSQGVIYLSNVCFKKIGTKRSIIHYTVRKIVLKLLLYLYFRTKVLKFRHDILIK